MSEKEQHPHSPLPGYRLIPEDQYIDPYSEDEIDLVELVQKIWAERWLIAKFVAVGAVLGVLFALLTPKEYVSTAKLMPEYSSESGGGASSLLKRFGGLAGIDVSTYNANSNAIQVTLYPDIVQSLSFQHELAQQTFYFAELDSSATLYDYYLELAQPGFLATLKKYTIGLPGLIIGSIFSEDPVKTHNYASQPDASQPGGSEIISLPKDKMNIIGSLRGNISANLDEKSGIITVSAKFGDPNLAAQVAKYTIEALTAYLVEYRTEKVLRDLRYLEAQLADAEGRFKKAQDALADFRDSNRGTLTNRAQTEEERLTSEYNLSFSIYNSLSQQREQAKLKVQEETPVFKVLQPVLVPVDDETSGAMILIVWVMLSGIVSIGWIFGKEFVTNFTSREDAK